MIPLKLAIEGLYSYQQRQEIDFEYLTASGLFGIFGRVGAGKTSILEAISFVLYGESERLNSRENRQYNMMNLKSNQTNIDFEFMAGADKQHYRYTFKAERNTKKHHEIKPGKRQVYRQENGEWIPQPIEKEDIKVFTRSVLGLDYENFKRTIIIPQNQFREFLELDPKSRSEMMKQLFDLERFELGNNVTPLEKANEAAINAIRGQLTGLEQASPETIEAAAVTIETIKAEIEEHAKHLVLIRERAQRLEHLQKRYAELSKAQHELADFISQQTDFEELRTRISEYEHCERVFRAMLNQVMQLAQKQTDGQAALKKAEEKRDAATNNLLALNENYQTAKAVFDTRDVLAQKRAELETVSLIRANQQTIGQQTETGNNLREKTKQVSANIQKKTTERADQQRIINELANQESNLERLNEIRNWFTGAAPLKKEVNSLAEKIAKYEAALLSIKQRKDDALTGFAADWAELQLKDLPDTIRQTIEQRKQEVQTKKAIHEANRLRQTLKQYATALADGEPCPLCGSEHHPAVHQDWAIDAAVAQSKRELQTVETAIESHNNLLIKAEGLLGEIRTVHNQGKTLINDHADAVARQTAHADLFIWSDFNRDEEKAVVNAIKQENEAQKRLATARTSVQKLTTELETAERDRANLDAQAAGLVGQIGALQQTVTQQLGELMYFDTANVDAFNELAINALKTDLDNQFGEAKTNFDQAGAKKSIAETELTACQTAVLLAQQQQNQWQTEKDALETTIANALVEHGLTHSELETILGSNLDIDFERKRVHDFDLALNTAQTKTNDLANELADQPLNADALAGAQHDLHTAEQQDKRLNQQLGERRKAHDELTRQWAQKQTIEQEMADLMLRKADLDEMNKLFRASGFVKYVSTVYLNDLCQNANARFMKLTNNQLRLEFDDSNFIIRDFLNGGRTRLAKTLSGGQMFQAALSLALALSDNIQHITKSQQSLFFLDEGFGTLDKDSLQTVFETLKSLRKENRVVGIISHVEELQQEIDIYIRTVDNGEGSQIECSWALQ
jgi:DNA repair protein SbcC/Rad50